jgi:hypothetical protein
MASQVTDQIADIVRTHSGQRHSISIRDIFWEDCCCPNTGQIDVSSIAILVGFLNLSMSQGKRMGPGLLISYEM